jgi:hypothetical protein
MDRFINKWSFKETPFTGALFPFDNELGGMVKFDEIVTTATPVEWKPLDLKRLPTWVQYNQGRMNSCVASTKALMDSIKFYKRNALKREVKFSAEWIYRHRLPKIAGMVGTRAIQITKEIGNLHDALYPMCTTDDEIDQAPIDPWMADEAKLYRTNDEPILVPTNNIDVLASIIQATDKPIMTWFEFRADEWRTVPAISGYTPNMRHSVTLIPPKNAGEMTFGMYEGEKAIVIQDSWGLQYGIAGKRIIKESFLKKRNIFNQYDMRFKFDVSSRAHYDGTIISLQKCLQSLAYFPSNIAFVERIGPATQEALHKFQQANGLPQTGKLDDQTLAVVKGVFS